MNMECGRKLFALAQLEHTYRECGKAKISAFHSLPQLSRRCEAGAVDFTDAL
jgi:hypothetical protein